MKVHPCEKDVHVTALIVHFLCTYLFKNVLADNIILIN